ncbi:MAG: AAA family ATPase, partial [Prevotella sp.]|nr:AAA family ATPase [Prevotella sp.]
PNVCKIYGSLLHEAGALSKGHVVVCDRGTFIGTLWGDEERSVRQVVEAAQGGVLMIDEAYLLNSKSENDPGKLVIQLLMNILSDERQRDIAVVLCGYKEPMTKLLELNPGLHSRFPNRFEFADFTLDELLNITLLRIKEYGYQFTRSAWEKYKQMLKEAYTLRNPQTWGNARFIANQLERIYIQHALRCVKHSDAMDQRHLLLLTPADIQPIEVPVQRPRMGF